MVVLDTCAIIELCKEKITLSARTLRQIEQGAFILSISFAEIACKIKLGKLEIPTSVRELYHEFNQINHLSIIDIGIDEWLESIELAWPENKDPADRVLTAFAIKNKIALVSSDAKIKKFYKKVIW